MKKVFLVFTLIVSSILMSSCTAEEMELSKPDSVEIKNDLSPSMMQRDSIPSDKDGIDPPSKPIIVGTRPY